MEKIVYVIGVFDLFHIGHVELLKRAKRLGDKLIVAVNGDELVASYKRKPIFSETDRLAIVKACRYVDDAFIIRDYDNKEMIDKYHINIIAHGDDWTGESYMQQIRLTPKFIAERQIEFAFLPYSKGISTSEIIEKLRSM